MAMINMKIFMALLLLSLAVSTIADARHRQPAKTLMIKSSYNNEECCEECLDRATGGRASCSDEEADCEYDCESSCTCSYHDPPQCTCSAWLHGANYPDMITAAELEFKNVLTMKNN